MKFHKDPKKFLHFYEWIQKNKKIFQIFQIFHLCVIDSNYDLKIVEDPITTVKKFGLNFEKIL